MKSDGKMQALWSQINGRYIGKIWDGEPAVYSQQRIA
ncbi:hypothetical protein DES40_1741 [Litorimonas taeanensis]|uniref:Uncharacterized protein n=1 Tax=Litorimonas taeanensis TaxID=568099 RepID=A0A420WDD6_9PROT|nr:hypothetical protein DES40_1741 [Litorimonas taeanensis]